MITVSPEPGKYASLTPLIGGLVIVRSQIMVCGNANRNKPIIVNIRPYENSAVLILLIMQIIQKWMGC